MVAMGHHEPERIGLRDASDAYGIPYATLRTWIRRGKVRAWKLGRGRVEVDRHDIEEMIRPRPIN